MVALVYALNDSDERVRAEAANEIGDQLRKSGGCCCSPEVTAALTCALGDCDKHVRREAEKSLCACGYDVVEGCCDTCDACGGHAAPAPESNDGAAPAPAPAPPEDPKAYFPSRLKEQQTMRPSKLRSRLANLFGFLD
jgi:hypothetical protein